MVIVRFFIIEVHHTQISFVNIFVCQLCPWDTDLRELRAEAYIAQGELFKAIGDIRPTAKLVPDNTKAYLRMSLLHYQMGEEDESLM